MRKNRIHSREIIIYIILKKLFEMLKRVDVPQEKRKMEREEKIDYKLVTHVSVCAEIVLGTPFGECFERIIRDYRLDH